MSFLKKLFGMGGGDADGAKPEGEAEHRGFRILATPFKQDGQYQCCGMISKEVDGVTREHRFIRADRFSELDDAVSITLNKGRQIVDEHGDRVFQQ